jgi:hypothetical protein
METSRPARTSLCQWSDRGDGPKTYRVIEEVETQADNNLQAIARVRKVTGDAHAYGARPSTKVHLDKAA